MTCWWDIYGEDRDGNRGMKVIEYQLDKIDKQLIAEDLYIQVVDYDDEIPETFATSLYCDLIDDNIDVEVPSKMIIDDFEEMVYGTKTDIIDEYGEQYFNKILNKIQSFREANAK